MKSIQLSEKAIKNYDVVVIATDHDDFDYALLASHAKLIIDTRNAMGVGLHHRRIVKA